MKNKKISTLITSAFLLSIILVIVAATQLTQITLSSAQSSFNDPTTMGLRKTLRASDNDIIWIWVDLQNRNIYTQKINNAEQKLWTSVSSSNGVLVYTAGSSITRDVDIITDMDGGAILTWVSGNQLLAQHVNNNGGLLWNSTNAVVIANNIKLGTLENINTSYHLVEDGIGGAFIFWTDADSNFSQYIHIDGAGTIITGGQGTNPSLLTASPGPNLCNSSTSAQCLSLNVVNTGISIIKVPDSFTFPPQFSSPNSITYSMNNYNGVDEDDRITVQSNGASGFSLQIQASGPFSNGNSSQDIPTSNLYVVTSNLANDELNGPATNGVQYTALDGGTYITTPTGNGLKNITAPLNISDPNNLKIAAKYKPGTGSGASLSSVVNLMQSPKTKKSGLFTQYISYLLEINPNQPPGTYQTTLTFTAIPN